MHTLTSHHHAVYILHGISTTIYTVKVATSANSHSIYILVNALLVEKNTTCVLVNVLLWVE